MESLSHKGHVDADLAPGLVVIRGCLIVIHRMQVGQTFMTTSSTQSKSQSV